MFTLKEKKTTAVLLMIDFSKAFDTLRHDFVFNTLKQFVFGPNFTKGIKILMTGRKSRVNLGGHFTDPFKLQRGVP